ncbi:nucleotidyltransferase domain-containing protein [Metabacillus iocasae]|uniref:Nucleotidyltransferase n=1 Tax=Priestia iocasae TaxID=2291674 RepID=A0ABS2R2T9_9BACI|nr:nucleotidyltransferase domain-containing protein [Metabacillus iocasae]MBM7705034.1 hypothetical protein [Metabacillus iocasae]
MKRLPPFEAATKFVQTNFPTCQGALLAGSVTRGEETSTSDLDIVIFDSHVPSSYRQSLIECEWPIEVFVHNLHSYQHFFQEDYKRARPCMQRMVAEGLVLKDEGVLAAIKKEAVEMLEKGPERWSPQTIIMKRYFLTDALDDFIGSEKREEDICIANTLAELIHEFVLRTNGQWIGASKWIIRSLRQFNPIFATQYIQAFDAFYQQGEKQLIVVLVDEILEPYGGKLFQGFSIGK